MRGFFVAMALAAVASLGMAGVYTAANAKPDHCICAVDGNGNGSFKAPKKVRELAAALALAAVHSGAMDNMDSVALSDYAIDVARRVAYADLSPFEPTDEP